LVEARLETELVGERGPVVALGVERSIFKFIFAPLQFLGFAFQLFLTFLQSREFKK